MLPSIGRRLSDSKEQVQAQFALIHNHSKKPELQPYTTGEPFWYRTISNLLLSLSHLAFNLYNQNINDDVT